MTGTGEATNCELCEASHITPWFYEDERCWVAECEQCWVPMVVWKHHDPVPSADERAAMLQVLAEVVKREYDYEHYVDENMRTIPQHYHAHARPIGRMSGHGLRRRAQ
jgi:hypothetical protein